MNNRERIVQDIRRRLQGIEKDREIRERLPEDTRITFGRYSGLFLGRYRHPEDPDRLVWVQGETYEEVEATIAMKLELDLNQEEE